MSALPARLVEVAQFVDGFVPVDMSLGANTAKWVNLANYDSLAIVFFKAAGAAGEAPTITVNQAKDTTGTGTKALNFTDVYLKDNADISTVGTFTKTVQASGNTYAPAAGNTQGIYVICFRAEELDIENGFKCVQASVADVGVTAQVGGVLYIASNARYAGATLPAAN